VWLGLKWREGLGVVHALAILCTHPTWEARLRVHLWEVKDQASRVQGVMRLATPLQRDPCLATPLQKDPVYRGLATPLQGRSCQI
jgi:hypothetical protein